MAWTPDTWAAVSIPVPHKSCVVGFALQSAKGTAAANPTVALPVHEDTDVGPDQNLQFIQFADGRYQGPKFYYSGGYTVPGTLRMPIFPGMMETAGGNGGYGSVWGAAADDVSDIGAWCFARSPVATGLQGLWATIFIDAVHSQKKYADVKVLSGQITAQYGQLLVLEANILGIAEPVDWTPNYTGTDYISETTEPYTYEHCALSLEHDTQLVGIDDKSTQDHTLSFDNMVASADEAGTLSGQETPLYLPSGELATWTGTFSRHFFNSLVYEAFLQRQTVEYTLVATQTGVATLTITFPRCLYTAAPLRIPNTGFLRQEGISFQALSDASDVAFSVSEVVT